MPDDLSGPFLLDVMLGSLATYLRMCGYDAAYALDGHRGTEADDELLAAARREDRTLLTRDVQLAARAGDRGVLLESRDVTDQLRELHAAGLGLSLDDRPARCGSCNGPVARVADGERAAHAPDDRAAWACERCGQQFWRGSHWDRVAGTLAEIRAENEPN
ncbi:Mut7-C RNAse domain-containing protein [Haloglomus litoreum]|uniref:Mut7-C RNAse domain-containing protein n=1 Tax=Haloglomus litoreum TaxID=3034026 RepID=UPI0023E862B0|nr:Mut7-C RNAse domain-containing protein [Haloglomus sp. DT116]